MTRSFSSSTQGMATLSSSGLELFDALESLFKSWADQTGARRAKYPSLIRVDDLDQLNYFRNFPQLIMCACTLEAYAHKHHSQRNDPITTVESGHLQNAGYCLPPAACYSIYLDLHGKTLDATRYVTTVASCFRNEDHFDGLQRLRNFTMREIVCIGSGDAVKAHLRTYRNLLTKFHERLGLPVAFEVATDPFFDKEGVSARAARIFPTKEELVFDGHLAIGSVNYHRRFFGQRCNITIDGKPASTGCVAFGIERWIHALDEHFDGDLDRILTAIEQARNYVSVPSPAPGPVYSEMAT